MALTCSQCSRVNPPGASYCYFDGSSLNRQGGPQNIGSQQFPTPFKFPSGRSCRSFDQLAQGCQEEWAAAVKLLRSGEFEGFLGGLGRMDLAMAASAAAAFPDADRGLDQLLERLPTQALAPPKLKVEPAEIDLGTLRADSDHRFELRVANQGMRLLYGAVVSGAKWLCLGEGRQASPRKLFQCSGEMVIPVTVLTGQIRAGNKAVEGNLTIESNGGTVTIRVRATVPSKPFPEGVLAGALSPRQLAEKARDNPKVAAPFFQNGAVERWYKENGWTYPVQGPAASGLGAVQQFFEALGLAKAPKVELSEPSLSLRGRPGDAVRQTFQVRTPEKRPVFASASSNQAWLTIGPVQLNGPVATIPVEVARVPDQPGQTLQARVTVTANGGQRFVVPVSLTVGTGAGRTAAAGAATAGANAAVAAGPAKARPLPPPRTPVRKRAAGRIDDEPERSNAKLFMVLGGLLLLLLLAGGGIWIAMSGDEEGGGSGKVQLAVHDDHEEKDKKDDKGIGLPVTKVDIQDEPEEVTDPKGLPVKFKIDDEPEERLKDLPKQPVKVEIKDEPEEVQPGGKVADAPLDPMPRLVYQYGPQQRFGITARFDPAGRPLNKRITFSDNGGTSNTRIRVNGGEGEFGEPSGRWAARAVALKDDPVRQSRNGTISVLGIGAGPQIRISQIVEIVPSKQPVMTANGQRRVFDTVLCRYIIENKDRRAHSVGLRVQVDTLIGFNDGVPFTVPGLPGLVDRMADFRTPREVPEFIQALEVPNLLNPGTVAHMTLKLGGRMEPPDRVSLTHWAGSGAPWEVAMRDMGGDSAVIIYWNEKVLKPGQRREFGYAYGLGRVDAGEGGGRLAITLSGSYEPGQMFTVTAYVNNPVPGQTLKLETPRGLEPQGAVMVPVPRPMGGQNTSIVTWNVKVVDTGEHRIRVVSSTGTAQSKTITIVRPDGPASGKLALDIKGDSFEPGKTFAVVASVTPPQPKQMVKLTLPRGLERIEGDEEQPLPPAGAPGGTSSVTWKVKIIEAGKFPVRVSTVGVAQTKTLTIVQDQGAGRFRVSLDGDFAPGKNFTVTAHVAEAAPGQTLTLKVPPELERLVGEEKQAVPKGNSSQVRWTIKITKAGKFPLRVESSTGVTQKKTITIENADVSGRFVLELSGDIAPGKEFFVTARVATPVKDQKLTLTLPEQLKLTEGAAEQLVPGTGVVRWKIRVASVGVMPVRVASSTGVARTKTITLRQEKGSGGLFD
jgi:hypothetical protein